ncbi:MAG: AEC family transporter [Treponema sp.]|nr:AEC family transporter [Treponema sp.]
MFFVVFKQLLIMALIVLGGFTFAKVFKVDDKEQKFLSKLLIYFINPFLILNALNIDFEFSKFVQLALVFLLSLVVHFIMIGLALLFARSKNPDEKDYCTLDALAMMFSNCGFIGIPLIRGVFGDEGVFYLMGFLVAFNVIMWTYGYSKLSGRVDFKKIATNPNMIAVILGLIVFFVPYPLPEVASKAISMIGELNSATAMILIGVLFSGFTFETKYIKHIIKVCFVRLIFVGLVVSFLILVIYKFLAPGLSPADSELVKMILFVVLICSACPCATSVPSLACLFNKDGEYSSMLVCLTSLLCMISVPAVVAFAEMLFKYLA